MSLDQTTAIVKHQTPTRDAFLGGRLSVLQPRDGFRAGLDSVLLGAAIDPQSLSLLDLGTGVGVAALVALANAPRLDAVMVDSDPNILAIAAANVSGNGFEGRARTLLLDVTARGAERVAAGLRPDHFTSVVANPPYYFGGTRAPRAQRAGSRHMDAEALGLWIRAAVASVAPRGEVIFINPAENLPALLAGFVGRLGGITVMPLIAREGQPANRVLVRGIKGSRAPMTLLASRVLHEEASGHRQARDFDAILRGAGRLVW